MLCKNCGKELPIAGKFYPFCGAAVEQTGVNDETAVFTTLPDDMKDPVETGPIDTSAFDAAMRAEKQQLPVDDTAANPLADTAADPLADTNPNIPNPNIPTQAAMRPIDTPPVRRTAGTPERRTTYYNGEQALEIADSLIRSSAIDIIVIDSVAALTPKAEIEGEMGDAKMGLQARLMSQALRKLTSSISKTKTVCIFINQLRDKIGVVYGNPETTTGGNALKFYASVRIDIRRVSVIKDGEEQLGTRTRVKVVKNKVAPPFKKAEFDIMFGEGISKIGEIIDLGVDYGIIKKSGSWFSYGDRKIGQGRDSVKELLKNDEALRNEVEAKVREAMIAARKA